MITQEYLIALLVDFLLVMGFSVQHSIFATIGIKKVIQNLTGIDPVSWRGVQSLINVSYIATAACLWREVPIVVWNFTGILYWVTAGILVLGWLWYFQIHIFEYDCGQAFGSTAVLSRLTGRKPPPMEMWKVGTRRWLRFPVHTAFFPMFFAFPRMTLSMLLFAVVGNINNIIGTVFYDKRMVRLVGEPYKIYQGKTGLLLYPLRKAREGAAAIQLPAPTHWQQPLLNAPGIVLGMLAGLFYWRLLGVTTLNTQSILSAWGASFVVAIVGGIIVGLLFSAQSQLLNQTTYYRLLTILATNMALVSAVSLVTWSTLAYMSAGTLPLLYIFFSMWLTVLWIGHVTSFYTLYTLRHMALKGDFAKSGTSGEMAKP